MKKGLLLEIRIKQNLKTMKQIIIFFFALLILTACNSDSDPTPSATQGTVQEQTLLQSLIKSYETALNTSDVQLAVNSFTDDGVLMQPGVPTFTGSASLVGAYEFAYAQFNFNITLTISEIVVDGDLAYVITSSSGTSTDLGTNETIAVANRELFVCKKVDGVWKIARYMFNQPQ
ncbi:hypothetical protein BKI52_15385 [marine bacterium AO1-C]|nr:hypothetical protein BKI52_15385 [marine bacterium AO1-C]